MLDEYNHGMADGLTITLKTLTKISEHPEIQNEVQSGLNLAILTVKTLQEEHSRRHDDETEEASVSANV